MPPNGATPSYEIMDANYIQTTTVGYSHKFYAPIVVAYRSMPYLVMIREVSPAAHGNKCWDLELDIIQREKLWGETERNRGNKNCNQEM